MRRAPGRGAEDFDVADVFADPAFAPWKAQGAGFAIVRPAAREVVWANAAATAHWGAGDARALARALFGGGGWLGTATRGLVPGGAPRLARAGLATPSLRARTIVARSWAGADGTVLLAFALHEGSSGPGAPPDAWRRGAWARPGGAEPDDGTREADAPEGERGADAVGPTRTELARRSQVAVLRDRLSAAVDGATALRLLWRTDGRGVVTRIDADAFARLGSPVRFGPLPLPDTIAAFDAAAGEALRGALASEATWSGVTLSLPVADAAAVVPMTMSASPVFGADRRFAGFRGFGTLDLARLDVAARAEPERPAADAPPDMASHPAPADDEGGAAGDRSGEQTASRRVVRLRAVQTPGRVSPAAEEAPDGEPAAGEGSGVDQAFRALGDALRAQIAVRHEDGPTAPILPTASEGDGGRAEKDDGSAPPADPSPAALPVATLPVAAPRVALPPGLLAALPAAMLVTVDGTTAYANDAAAALLGHPDTASLLAAGAASPVEASSAAAEGTPVRRRDGRTDAVSADGWPIAWDGAAATLWLLRGRNAPPADPLPSPDEARDAAPDERSGELLDRVDDAVALLDADGRIRRLNERGAAWFDGGDAVGQSFTQLLAADSRTAGLALLEEVRGRRDGTGLPPGRRDVLARTAADPTPVPMLLTLGRLGAQGFYATLRDVSALRRAEIEGARVQRDRTRDAGRLTELLAKVDHGVRTPLNAILGFAEVMMDERFGALGNPRYRDYLRDIHAAGTQVVRMIGDLFDLSRIEAGQIDGSPAAVDLNRIVGDTVGHMQPEAHRERVIMRMSLAVRLAPILADERSVRQIVQHLLSNAVKFNEPGGQVIVSTAQGEPGTAVLRVRDTGIGMTEDEVAAALEPFGRAASSGAKGGLGLGLPLTRALADANRASIVIRSRPREGTLIEVVFTAADPDSAPPPS